MAGGVVLAAQEILLAVTQVVGSLFVASVYGRGRGDGRGVGGGPLVPSVTLADHRHVLLVVPQPGVHLPAVPATVGTLDVVVLVVLDASIESVFAVSDEPVSQERGGGGVRREKLVVHILVPDHRIARSGSSQTKAAERLFLVLQALGFRGDVVAGAGAQTGGLLEHFTLGGSVIIHTVVILCQQTTNHQ